MNALTNIIGVGCGLYIMFAPPRNIGWYLLGGTIVLVHILALEIDRRAS